MNVKKLQAILISCLTVLSFSSVAFAVEQIGCDSTKEPVGNLVVNISTGNPENMFAAVKIAKVAAGRGHNVSLLLRMKAIEFTLRNKAYPVFGTTIKQELVKFMKTGSDVIVGGGCLKLMGISKNDLMDGLVIGNPDIVMGALFQENTRVLSY